MLEKKSIGLFKTLYNKCLTQ